MKPAFSVKLQELIDNTGETIYGFAKRTGLERSNIYKVLSGERKPSAMFVLRLIDTLGLTDDEKGDLLIGFAELEAVGKEVQEQLLIQDIFAKLTEKSDVQPNKNRHELGEDVMVAQGEEQVNRLVRRVLSGLSEQETVFLTIPFLNSSGFLKELWKRFIERKINIKHLLQFSGESTRDLEILSNLLPFVISDHNGYEVSCLYGGVPISSVSSPWYLLTDREVVCFSVTMDSALVHQGKEAVEFFREGFELDVKKSTGLFKTYNDGINNIIGYEEANGSASYALTYSPCFARVYTEEIINRKIKQGIPHRDSIVKAAIAYLLDTPHVEKEVQLISLAGLDLFMREGKLPIMPDDYAEPFTLHERKELLSLLVKERKNGLSLHLIDETKFHLPAGLFVTLNEQDGLCFHFVHPKDKSIQCFVLEKGQLSRSIKTFIVNMRRREFVFDEAETLCTINSYL